MAPLLVGDDIVTADDPARILVVDGPEGVRSVQEALREYHDLLKVEACHDLQSGLEAARTGMHHVILLALQLPDAWPVDVYCRFRQEVEDRPILVIASSHDAGVAARNVPTPPFCVIERQQADPAQFRRLIVSAVLFERAGGRPPHSSMADNLKRLLQPHKAAAVCSKEHGGERKAEQ